MPACVRGWFNPEVTWKVMSTATLQRCAVPSLSHVENAVWNVFEAGDGFFIKLLGQRLAARDLDRQVTEIRPPAALCNKTSADHHSPSFLHTMVIV
jgi:hypothetical protein